MPDGPAAAVASAAAFLASDAKVQAGILKQTHDTAAEAAFQAALVTDEQVLS